jgi:hypothetical protein
VQSAPHPDRLALLRQLLEATCDRVAALGDSDGEINGTPAVRASVLAYRQAVVDAGWDPPASAASTPGSAGGKSVAAAPIARDAGSETCFSAFELAFFAEGERQAEEECQAERAATDAHRSLPRAFFRVLASLAIRRAPAMAA